MRCLNCGTSRPRHEVGWGTSVIFSNTLAGTCYSESRELQRQPREHHAGASLFGKLDDFRQAEEEKGHRARGVGEALSKRTIVLLHHAGIGIPRSTTTLIRLHPGPGVSHRGMCLRVSVAHQRKSAWFNAGTFPTAEAQRVCLGRGASLSGVKEAGRLPKTLRACLARTWARAGIHKDGLGPGPCGNSQVLVLVRTRS
jgi:hypothetical protein